MQQLSVKDVSHKARRLIMKTKDETSEKQEKASEKALNEKELETVAGGLNRRATGPGTQTEDDIYVGIK
jgi:hypothetical protein